MNYRKTIGSQIFRIIISIPFLIIFQTNFLANAAEDGTLKWSSRGGGSPAIGVDGTIYTGSNDDNLYAINPDGTQKWAFTTNGTVNSSAIGLDGTIYAGSDDYHLYAINPDGTQKWAFATNGEVNRSPAIGLDGTIYAGSVNYLYAINPDGTQKWAFYGSVSSPTIGVDGTIYVGSGYYLYAINSSSLGLANSAWPMYMHDVRRTGRAAAGQIPAPLANFDADALTGRAPLAVSFTDQSMGSITSWEWDFGDGSISTEQNPSHTYTDPDPVTYTVSLTVTGPGGPYTETKTDYIEVNHAAKAMPWVPLLLLDE